MCRIQQVTGKHVCMHSYIFFVVAINETNILTAHISKYKELRVLRGFFGPPMRLKYKNCFSPMCSY